MNCLRVAHQLTALNEGALSRWQRLTLRAHLGLCPACKAYAQQMDATAQALGEATEMLSDDESRAIAARIAAARK